MMFSPDPDCKPAPAVCSAEMVWVIAAETLTYAEVKERMNIPDEDVLRLLHSLACAKYKILSKDPPTKTLTKQDSFSVNTKFTSTMRRIKVIGLSSGQLAAAPCSLDGRSSAAYVLPCATAAPACHCRSPWAWRSRLNVEGGVAGKMASSLTIVISQYCPQAKETAITSCLRCCPHLHPAIVRLSLANAACGYC